MTRATTGNSGVKTMRIVLFVAGVFAAALGGLMVVPAALDAVNGNSDWLAFMESAVMSVAIGISVAMVNRGGIGEIGKISLRQGYLLTAASWFAVSLAGAVPFWVSGLNISFTDAVFESISGLTTTGSTVLTGLDVMPQGILMWRAMLQWVGGIGIVVMAVAVLPFLRVGGMQLFRMESSDRSDKLQARVADLSIQIFSIYLLLTVLCAVGYRYFGMSNFEATVHAMTTVPTGGYSTSDQSLGHFAGVGIQWVAIVFMLAGSLPFAAYVRFLYSFDARAFSEDSQIGVFLGACLTFTMIIGLWLVFSGQTAPVDAFRLAAFSIVSIATTTGYVVVDYLTWGPPAVVTFFMLTFVGGCAGSTAGGIKTFRLEVLAMEVRRQCRFLAYPNGVFLDRLNGKPVTGSLAVSVLLFVFLFAASATAMTILLAFTGLDFQTASSAAVTALANVGPGLGGIIGPSGNFQPLSDAAKWILDLGMLTGRLEFFTVLVVFIPGIWPAPLWR